MRKVPIVVLAACAVALAAAAIGDALTEAFANFSAGSVIDGHQESLFPAAGVAAVLVAIVCAIAIGAGRARAEMFARLLSRRWVRALFFIATGILTVAFVVAMEGYETRFGGFSAFDARSVLAHYLLPSLATYACVVVLVDRLLRFLVGAALSSWEALVRAALPFIRRRTFISPIALDACDTQSLQPDAGRAHPSWSLRAPPMHGQLNTVTCFWRSPWRGFVPSGAGARSL